MSRISKALIFDCSPNANDALVTYDLEAGVIWFFERGTRLPVRDSGNVIRAGGSSVSALRSGRLSLRGNA